MGKKIGRNDPCPCGSGKKYKKCCGAGLSGGGYVSTPDDWFPESDRTGTIWDDYMGLVPGVAMYAKKVMQFDEDGRELEKAQADFEKNFRPGEDDGVPDSYFMGWVHFDFRFGPSHQTVAERLLEDPMISNLQEPGITYLRQLSDSYSTFFEIIEESSDADTALVEELGTGERFNVHHVRLLLNIEPKVGEIWFSRRIGFPDLSIFYSSPFVFAPGTGEDFKRIVKKQEKDFRESRLAALFPGERHFAESQKEAARFWAWYCLRGLRGGPSLSQIPGSEDPMDFPDGDDIDRFPHLVTTDGEEFILTEVHFRVRDESAVRKRLSTLRSFPHEDHDDSWAWLKAKSRKFPDKPRTLLARFRIDGERLVAETNSRERAGRLRVKLKKHLGDLIAYEKTLYRDIDDMPERSPEEIEAQRKQNEELNADPEIRKALKQHLEHHYFKEWPLTRLPALGNKTPLQAVKTETGRKTVLALIEDIERNQDAPSFDMPKLDFDRLRRRLGLPPRAN